MADRFPLIINSVDQQIQELSSGDNLDLTDNSLINANHIQTSDMDVVGVMTATKFKGDASELENLPESGGTFEATASGTLADGSTVIVNTDGTVSVVTQTETTGAGTGSATTFEGRTGGGDYTSAVFDSNSNRIVLFYRLFSNYNGVAIVGEISGGSITFGSPVDFETTGNGVTTIHATFDSTNNKVVVGYRLYASNGTKYHHAKVGTVDPSNNSIEFGAAEIVNSNGESSDFSMTFDPSSGKIVVAYRDESNSSYGTAKVGVITVGASPSNDTISFGSANVFFNSGQTVSTALVADTSNNRIVLAGQDDGVVNVRVGEVDGTSITFGSPETIYGNRSDGGISIAFDASTNKVVVVRTNQSNLSDPYRVYAHVITVDPNDNSIDFGSGQQVASKGYLHQNGIAYDSGGQKLIIVYKNANASLQAEYIHATVNPSNDTITFSSATNYDSNNNNYFGVTPGSNSGQCLIWYQHDISKLGTAHVVGLTGFPVPEIGSAELFKIGPSYPNSATFDSYNNKVVIAYKDLQNSGYGTAVVGTVTDTGITFGTPVPFENSNSISFLKITFDSSENKVVIIYNMGSGMYGYGIVGEVSGDTITFGSATPFTNYYFNVQGAVFDSSKNKIVAVGKDESNSTGVCYVGTVSGTSINFGSKLTFKNSNLYDIVATFDSSNNKVVIGYQDTTNGNKGAAVVGEVSGTSINFGSSVVFSNNNSINYPLALTFDSNNNKVVFAYRDGANSNYGTAVVGEVSGTSSSFGTPVVFHSAQAFYISATFDSSNNNVVIAFQDSVNSYYGTAVAGTVSGTSISFGSATVFESANTNYIETTFDSTNNRAIFTYRDDGYGDSGTAITFSPRTISRNLTAENFIGISNGAYTNGQTATVQLIGSVDDAQSSLTPGQKYYVQNDGTLSTTADDPSVMAGTAVAATKLMIKK